jgi:hypothetical protein
MICSVRVCNFIILPCFFLESGVDLQNVKIKAFPRLLLSSLYHGSETELEKLKKALKNVLQVASLNFKCTVKLDENDI